MGQIFKVGCAEAEVIESSMGVSNKGICIETIRLRYPRMVHSDFMTHRQLSKNARSSRAVPTATLLKEEIYIPQFLHNISGMQGGEILSNEDMQEAEKIWRDAANYCKKAAKKLNKLNVHKQHANRMLEWFGWIDVLVTSTHWENFYKLRNHKDAQPEIKDLAQAIIQARSNVVPKILGEGEWHLPYITSEEREKFHVKDLLVASTSRCARISYNPFNMNNICIEKDFELFEKLTQTPLHASPLEHQATPDYYEDDKWLNKEFWGNFYGWIQHRKIQNDEAGLDWFQTKNLDYKCNLDL